jgi:hypothetical protein
VRTAFNCRSSDQTLQAKGSCTAGRNGIQGASCGPSYEYLESSGRCQQIFEDEQLVAQLTANTIEQEVDDDAIDDVIA